MIQRTASGLSKNTFLVTAGSLFAEISTEMLTPVLPIFLTQALHANGSIVGLVDGIAQAVRNLMTGFSGSISYAVFCLKSKKRVCNIVPSFGQPLMGVCPIL